MELSYEQALKTLCQKSYYDFFKHFWETVVQDPLIENWHIKYLCNELQKVGEWVINREPKEYDLLINISPGESKSTICTILFPAWLWTRDASIRVISTSYSEDLALDHAKKSKDCVLSYKYQLLFPNVQIRKDTKAAGKYFTTKKGERQISGTKGTITGKHAHLIIWDDPLSPKLAASKAEVKAANDFINKTLSSRKVDRTNTPTIGIMQRLHESDPSGDWIKKMNNGEKRIKHICIPATDDYEVKPSFLRNRYVGGIMNPHRTGKIVLEEARADLGSHEYAGQYGQNPQPIKGNLVKRNYLPILSLQDVPPDFWTARKIAVGDLAQTAKETNDPNGILIFKVVQNKIYLIDFHRYWKEFEDNKATIVQILQSHQQQGQLPPIYIENKSAGLDMVSSLVRNYGINAISWKVGAKDKVARLKSVLSYFESGRVVIVKGNWNYEEFINQHLVFPNGKHDEEVDCAVMAIDVGLSQTISTAPARRRVQRINF
ncbi:MAG: phage terminase large subunit [Bacteroidota bacterium]